MSKLVYRSMIIIVVVALTLGGYTSVSARATLATTFEGSKVDNTAQAVENADSHEYFAENKPALETALSNTFADVPDTYWAWSFIERLYSSGITGGCSTSPLMYCPLDSVTRAQMAVFILRGVHGGAFNPPAATGTVFSDVSVNSFAAAWIEQFTLEGITSGCGSGMYCPDANVTRAQMAIFLLKGKYGLSYVPPVATGIFPDVPVDSFAADWIEQLTAEGITSGCGGGLYCPNANITRDQMAVFLVKTFLNVNNFYYVSPNGSDDNPGTQAQPWKTIQKAANTVSVSGTVIVSAGNYGEGVSVSHPGIKFEANGSVNMKGFYITGNNTTVTGFTINDTPSYGIELHGSNSTIKNNTIIKGRNAGIWVSGQNNLIEGNDVSQIIQPAPHSSGGDANCFTFFGSGHTFRGNYCHDIYSDGILVTDAHIDGFQTWDLNSAGGVGHDIVFENNLMMFQRGGKIWNIEEGAYNIVIKNNITLAELIVLIIDGSNISFLNNTFIGTGWDNTDGLHLLRTDVTMYNNIFAHQRQRVIENLGGVTITASNNCYIDYGVMLPANPGDIRSTNAFFVNESLRDYHLQPNSPCIDKGVTLTSVLDDKDGISRPRGSGYDMGAFEFSGTN